MSFCLFFFVCRDLKNEFIRVKKLCELLLYSYYGLITEVLIAVDRQTLRKFVNFHRQHLLVQCQQWKHQNSVWNLFKVNSESNHVSDFFLVSSLLNLNRFHTLFLCFLFDSIKTETDGTFNATKKKVS